MGLRIGQPLESMEIEIQEKLLETLKNSKKKKTTRARSLIRAHFFFKLPPQKM